MRRLSPGTFGVASLLLAGLLACGKPSTPRSLIVICIDTLRADHVGAYGYERDTTPHLDALAREGVLFEKALSTSNWTVPAVASFFTSAPPSRHGAGLPGALKNLDEVPPTAIAPDLGTLTDVLKAQGFRTGLFSANPFLYGSFQRSFDESVVGRMQGESLVDAAIEWSRQSTGERTFLYVQFMDAHQPNNPPEPYFNLYPTPDAGPREPRHADWRYGALLDPDDPAFRNFRDHRTAVYDGSIRYIDDQIRRLLDGLEAAGMLRDSLVVVYSDHGEELWDHAAEQAGLGDDPRGIWGIGHGHSMYQELLHVPLILWRGDRTASRVVDCPVSILDIAPTVLDILGIERLETMTGRSLTGLIDRSDKCGRRALVAESPAYGPDSAALVLWPKKLVRRGEHSMLFDLERDPGERQDVASTDPESTRALAAILGRFEQVRHDTGPAHEIDPETLEQLRSLGYLSN